jgi:outer membrane protein
MAHHYTPATVSATPDCLGKNRLKRVLGSKPGNPLNFLKKNFGNFEVVNRFHSFVPAFSMSTRPENKFIMNRTIKNSLSIVLKNITGLLLLLLLSRPAMAQDNQQANNGSANQDFTLKQAVDYALAHQASVVDARIDEKIASEKIREIRGIGLPQVNGSIELDDYIAKPQTILPGVIVHSPVDVAVSFVKQYQAAAGISASQLIFDGSYLVGLQAAKTYAELSRKTTKSTAVEVVANVTKAYYGVLVNERRINSLDANIQLLQKNLDDAKAMNVQGFVEKLDVDRLTVALSALQVQRQNVKSSVELINYLLKFQMGMPVNMTVTLVDSLSASQFPAPAPEKSDYEKRIEYSLAQTGIALGNLDLRRYKAGYLPSLAAFGSLSENAYRDEFNFFDTEKWYTTGLIGLKLTVPIFDGFQKDARVQQAKLSVSKYENDINNLKNLIDLQVKQSDISYENNYKILQSQRANLKLAEDIARVTKIKYNQGVGSNIEVVTAETALREAQTNYFGALYDLSISYVDLQKAKGTLY